MRLNKYLARSGVCSRRAADELIFAGQIKINEKTCKHPATSVDLENDLVAVNGKAVTPVSDSIVIMLNKPCGVVSTCSDPHLGKRKSIMDLVKTDYRLHPIGRLDKETSGLILLTNDGELHDYLTHPRNAVPRDYIAHIGGRLTDTQVQQMRSGIKLPNGIGRAEVLQQQEFHSKQTIVELRLRHGKKREIRYIFAIFNIKLLMLQRVRFGSASLGSLKEGQYRKLAKQEIQSLWRSGKKSL